MRVLWPIMADLNGVHPHRRAKANSRRHYAADGVERKTERKRAISSALESQGNDIGGAFGRFIASLQARGKQVMGKTVSGERKGVSCKRKPYPCRGPHSPLSLVHSVAAKINFLTPTQSLE